MKPIRKILALLCLAGLSLFANAQGGLQQQPGFPYQISGTYVFTSASGPSGGFNVQGLRYWQISFVTIGTVSSCSVSLDSSTGGGFTIGGIISAGTIGSCASPGVYTNSTATTPTLVGQLTPTITGSGSVIVVILGYVNNPGVSGSSAASITSPVDGSGYVEVNCKTGCGSTTLGQTVMASSLPVAIASNQSAVPVSGTFWQTTQPVSLATAPTTPVTGTFWQTTQPVSIATMPTTPVTGTFWQTTQPVSGTVTANQGGTWNVAQSGTWTVTATQATGSNLHVVCDSGCSSSAGFADNSSFTVGTTPVNILGGYYTTGAAPTLTNGSAARARIDSNSYLYIDCATGCFQTTQPVSGTVTANAGTGTFNVNLSQLDGTNLGAPSAYGTSPGAVNVPGVNAYVTNTVPVSGTFYQATQPVSLATAPTTPTQPSGFSSSPLTAQVSVTATAAALASNSTHTVCVEAVIANTIPVYVGASGVTTSTGFALNPGDEFCWQVNNSNLLYLIASTTGASIQWTAL